MMQLVNYIIHLKEHHMIYEEQSLQCALCHDWETSTSWARPCLSLQKKWMNIKHLIKP